MSATTSPSIISNYDGPTSASTGGDVGPPYYLWAALAFALICTFLVMCVMGAHMATFIWKSTRPHVLRKGYPRGSINFNFVANKDGFIADLEEAGLFSTVSSYGTNIIRLNQGMAVVSTYIALLLCVLLGLNQSLPVLYPRPHSIAVPIMLGYICHICTGFFPSGDVTKDENRQRRRDWAIVLWTTLDRKTSGIIHLVGTFVFTFVPTVCNIVFYSRNPYMFRLNLAFSIVALTSIIFFLTMQAITIKQGASMYFWLYMTESLAFIIIWSSYFYNEISSIMAYIESVR